MSESLDYLRQKARELPLEPGVYLMRNSEGTIIYIGKAKALRNRVSSYFRSLEKHHPKVLRMVRQAHDFDTIVTSSEFEALVLECSLIKQHKPKYNILLKDDKGYHYIKISAEPYPRITAEKMIQPKDPSRYLGPYTSGFVVSQTVDEVTRVFSLPTCHRTFPQDFRKGRPCLNYHIKQCPGICTGRISQADYAETIREAVSFIEHGGGAALGDLESQMEEAAESLDFERAAALRDRIRAVRRIREQQDVVFTTADNEDVLAIVQNGRQSCAMLLKLRGQRLVDRQDYHLGETVDLGSTRRDFLLSLYGGGAEIPRNIALDGYCEDHDLVLRFLEERRGAKVNLYIPQRGEGLRLVQMATANAAQELAHKVDRTGRELEALDTLARLLGLAQPPLYIEAYDISNLGSETAVGGMVVFENGRPLRSAYKKFNIKHADAADDYGAMREVLSRRFTRYREEKGSGEGFGRLPDLILLDGGKGHVSAIAPLLEEFGLSIPLYGMVKNQKHRTRAIATDGGEISITSGRSAFILVSKIQDETHRFAITHMKQRHSKHSFTSSLTGIPGIGKKRSEALLRHFKTQKALRTATVEELCAVPGMTRPAAQRLWRHFHPDETEKETG